jgi:hypothetical protein
MWALSQLAQDPALTTVTGRFDRRFLIGGEVCGGLVYSNVFLSFLRILWWYPLIPRRFTDAMAMADRRRYSVAEMTGGEAFGDENHSYTFLTIPRTRPRGESGRFRLTASSPTIMAAWRG